VCAGPSQDFNCAITHLRAALEAEPGEIRFWHALGLLLAATEQWDAARGALEQGAEFGESDRGNEDEEETPGRPLSPELPPTPQQQERVLARYFPIEDPVRTNGSADTDHTHMPEPERPDGDHDTTGLSSTVVPAVFLIDNQVRRIPPGETLLRPLLDHPRASRLELLEHALQLRMTQVAVAEYVEGAEGAVGKWVEVFTWVADQSGECTSVHLFRSDY
jgi:hypothetical protein